MRDAFVGWLAARPLAAGGVEVLRAGVAPHQLQPAAPRADAPLRQQLQLACRARAPSQHSANTIV